MAKGRVRETAPPGGEGGRLLTEEYGVGDSTKPSGRGMIMTCLQASPSYRGRGNSTRNSASPSFPPGFLNPPWHDCFFHSASMEAADSVGRVSATAVPLLGPKEPGERRRRAPLNDPTLMARGKPKDPRSALHTEDHRDRALPRLNPPLPSRGRIHSG